MGGRRPESPARDASPGMQRGASLRRVCVALVCVAAEGSFWSKKQKTPLDELRAKAAAAEAPVTIADSRYEKLAYREDGSRVECFRWGERVDEMEPEACHAGPPFWGWWTEFRNCAVTNACLLRNVLTLYSGRGRPASTARRVLFIDRGVVAS